MTPPLQERAGAAMKRRGLVGRPRLLLLALWLTCALTLAVCGIAFLACGAVRGRSGLWFFAGGALCAFASVPATATFLWYVFCQRPAAKSVSANDTRQKNANKTCNVSTVGGPDTYGAEAKSDYPMGPLLIMTLPKKKGDTPEDHPTANPNQVHFLSGRKLGDGLQSSRESTPDHVARRCQKRNTPPLASEETLSPSLGSASHVSIDSTV